MRINISRKTLAKRITAGVVCYGVKEIVTAIIENNSPATNTTKLPTRIAVFAGKLAISGIVSVAAKEYTDQLIDDVVNSYKEISDKVRAITGS